MLASIDEDDIDHDRSLAVLQRWALDLVVPALVLAEVCYFAGSTSTRKSKPIHPPPPGYGCAHSRQRRLARIADLVERYSDFPLAGTDASVAVFAERLGTDLIITLDRRHFGALRMRDGRPFTLLP